MAMIEYEFSHMGVDLNVLAKGNFLEFFDKEISSKSNHFLKNLNYI